MNLKFIFNKSIIEEFSLHPYHKLLLKIYINSNKLDIAQAGHYYIKDYSWKDFLKLNGISVVETIN
mgnify:CR=1 FL=1